MISYYFIYCPLILILQLEYQTSINMENIREKVMKKMKQKDLQHKIKALKQSIYPKKILHRSKSNFDLKTVGRKKRRTEERLSEGKKVISSEVEHQNTYTKTSNFPESKNFNLEPFPNELLKFVSMETLKSWYRHSKTTSVLGKNALLTHKKLQINFLNSEGEEQDNKEIGKRNSISSENVGSPQMNKNQLKLFRLSKTRKKPQKNPRMFANLIDDAENTITDGEKSDNFSSFFKKSKHKKSQFQTLYPQPW